MVNKVLPQKSVSDLNTLSNGCLPEILGMTVLSVSAEGLTSMLEVRRELMAGNGYLHAASVVGLADTTCGYGALAFLPAGAKGFTTVELKSNFIGTARQGQIHCTAKPVHLGRTTQVWDAEVRALASERVIAYFRCTQMILWA